MTPILASHQRVLTLAGSQTNGRQSNPSLAIPIIHEVRREKWANHQFDEFSAVQIAHNDESGYIFFVNIDNKFLINELSRTKEEEKSLVKHWFSMV